LLESRSYLDLKQALKAGEKYLEALAKRKTIVPEQRRALGERMRKADQQLLFLSRSLLSDAAFDLGDPPAPLTDTEATSTEPLPDKTTAATPPPASK
jgi:hypothetical protein